MMLTRREPGSSRLGSRLLVTATVVGLMVVGLNAPDAVADTAPPAGTPATVSADALPTWQINGVVRSQVTIGNIVYVAGSFSQARPPGVVAGGAGSVSAGNLFAYDITTGNPVPFSHTTDAQVMAITASPNGSTLYIGGDFKTVDGKARLHIAAFGVASGLLETAFAPSADGRVGALAVSHDDKTLYAGGSFKTVNGTARANLAAFNAVSGALTGWTPKTDGPVQSMVVAPAGDRVIIGGQFYLLDAVASYGMGSVTTTTGTRLPWAASASIKVTNKIGATVYRNGSIDTLRTDGTYIYGGGWSNGKGATFEGTFAAVPSTGAIYFVNDCHGDTYDVLPVGGVLYAASHSHSCQAIGGFPDAKTAGGARVEHRITAFSTVRSGANIKVPGWAWSYQGLPSSSLLDWFPDLTPGTFTPEHQAAYSLAGSSDARYISVGGEFPAVNGVAQQGLTRFAVSSVAPNAVGPTPTSVIAPTAVSTTSGTALVSWPAAWDKDNTRLTYTLYRLNSAGLGRVTIASIPQDSTFWRLPLMGFTDTGLTPGVTYLYQIGVTDPFTNTIFSAKSGPVTISAAAAVDTSFTTTGPCRIFDTRSGTGNCPAGLAHPVPKAPVGPGKTLTVKVTGEANVPVNATAVVVNLTAVGATANTWVAAWPAGGVRPTASNLNVSNAAATPNLAIVPVGAGGAISLYNASGSVNLIADISGYFAPKPGATLTTVTPCRLFDTRSGSGVCAGHGTVPKAPLGAAKTLKVKVVGAGSVPPGATAVVVNLTAVGATHSTWLTAWPTGRPRPTASNLNVDSSFATPNLAIVPIGTDGTISIYNAAGSVNLLGDISGYFSTATDGLFSPIPTGPCRIFDTRSGVGSCAGAATIPQSPVHAKGVLKIKVAGVGWIPSNATAVVLNLTGVSATTSTWVVAWPSLQPMPLASNINLHNASATPNLAIVPIGTDGSIELYNAAGNIDLVGDVFGYFVP